MSTRLKKAMIRELALDRNYNEIMKWAAETRNPQRVLMSLAFDADELVRMRAIEILGKTAGLLSVDLDRVRDMIRRLLWLMNDESGGLGWHSPEMIGEILVNVPQLIDEYASLLPAFLKEEPFERGTSIAIARLAALHPKTYAGAVEQIEPGLNDPDAVIRCQSALALEATVGEKCRDAILPLSSDSAGAVFYDFESGKIQTTTVGSVIAKILGRLDSDGREA